MLILLSIFNIYKIMEVEMDKLFKLKENNTSVRTEVVAGITTFMTMAYILAVNPSILSASGMDSNAILMATAIASAIGCFAMAFLANYPFALAPGLGLNAYFAYTVCGSMGYSWKVALFAVFVEGLVFIVLSLTNVREAIFNAIPTTLKKGVSVGIGLFVAFIGLQGANLVVASESTKVTVVNFRTNFNTVGIGALLAVIGTFIIAILYVKHVKGSILIGIVATWVLGIICQLTGLYKVDAAAGFYSLIPSWRSFDITAISLTFGQCFNLKGLNINILDFIVIMCSFLFVDMFDTLGTLIGVANKAKMLDENGRLPRIKQALLADAIATSAGAILGTSTTTTFVESSSGVAEGGRTGLSSVVTGFLFLIAIIFAPVFTTGVRDRAVRADKDVVADGDGRAVQNNEVVVRIEAAADADVLAVVHVERRLDHRVLAADAEQLLQKRRALRALVPAQLIVIHAQVFRPCALVQQLRIVVCVIKLTQLSLFTLCHSLYLSLVLMSYKLIVVARAVIRAGSAAGLHTVELVLVEICLADILVHLVVVNIISAVLTGSCHARTSFLSLLLSAYHILSRLSTNRAHKTSPSTCQFFNSMLFIFCRLCYDTDR